MFNPDGMIPMSPMTVTKHPYLLDIGGSRGDDLWVSPQLIALFVADQRRPVGPEPWRWLTPWRKR